MGKYRDISGMGKSKLFPKTYCEEPKSRHRKRYTFNNTHAEKVRHYCYANGIKLEIKNNGHHWIALKSPNLLEWWPSSAKVVLNKCCGRGIHVHDYMQFINLLAKKLK